jgi:hypothetical protein
MTCFVLIKFGMGDKLSGDPNKRHYPPKITNADPTELHQIYQELLDVQR